MATKQTPQKPKRRRATHRRKPGTKAKARKPRDETMTLKKFRALIETPINLMGSVPQIVSEAADRLRPRIESGDPVALYSALYRCAIPFGPGSVYTNASSAAPTGPVVSVPEWLLRETLHVLWNGIWNKWPKGPANKRRWRDARRDVVRTVHVLKARDEGVAWEDVFAHVAKTLRRPANNAKAIEGSYLRATSKVRSDPEYYRRLGVIFEPPPREHT